MYSRAQQYDSSCTALYDALSKRYPDDPEFTTIRLGERPPLALSLKPLVTDGWAALVARRSLEWAHARGRKRGG